MGLSKEERLSKFYKGTASWASRPGRGRMPQGRRPMRRGRKKAFDYLHDAADCVCKKKVPLRLQAMVRTRGAKANRAAYILVEGGEVDPVDLAALLRYLAWEVKRLERGNDPLCEFLEFTNTSRTKASARYATG
jgi:hypothetical protein